MLPQIFVAVSAAIMFLLGGLHLVYTFRGSKLHPRDAALTAQMMLVSPVISRGTTMWKAWIGFNASHSYGALLFGAVYGYLAASEPQFLFESSFLSLLGLVTLSAYVVVGKLYWFNVPYHGILVATACYVAGFAVRLI